MVAMHKQFYGMKEFAVHDPDGYLLIFAEEERVSRRKKDKHKVFGRIRTPKNASDICGSGCLHKFSAAIQNVHAGLERSDTQSKVRQLAEHLVTFINLFARQLLQTLRAERSTANDPITPP